MNEYRDTRIGDLLRRADEAPPLAAGFDERLWARIEREAASALPVTSRRASRFTGWARIRRWGLALATTAPPVPALVLLGYPGSGDVGERAPGGSTAQNPAGVAFTGPEPASAAEVARIVQKALRNARTIVADWYWSDFGRVHLDRLDSTQNKTHIVLCADGSYRMRLIDRPLVRERRGDMVIDVPGVVGSTTGEDGAYDSQTGIVRSYTAGLDILWFDAASSRAREAGGELTRGQAEAYVGVWATEVTHRDPTADVVSSTVAPIELPTAFDGIFRALRTADGGRVGSTTFDGRPAWVVSYRIVPQEPNPPDEYGNVEWTDEADRLCLTVDKATGLPVRATKFDGDEVNSDVCLVNLQVDVQVPEDTFSIEFPRGAYRHDAVAGSLELVDDGYRRVALDQVRDAVGRDPLVPAYVPRGYRLGTTAVKQRQDAPTDEQLAQGVRSEWEKVLAGTGIVTHRYERGFDALMVNTRLLDPLVVSESSAVRTDPFFGNDGWTGWPRAQARTPVTLASGAFAGARGFVVVAPLVTPHLWAVKDGVLLMVGGDASAAELVAVANSIHGWKP